jgi:hypothetical protein
MRARTRPGTLSPTARTALGEVARYEIARTLDAEWHLLRAAYRYAMVCQDQQIPGLHLSTVSAQVGTQCHAVQHDRLCEVWRRRFACPAYALHGPWWCRDIRA